jgi:hypothetical protein
MISENWGASTYPDTNPFLLSTSQGISLLPLGFGFFLPKVPRAVISSRQEAFLLLV